MTNKPPFSEGQLVRVSDNYADADYAGRIGEVIKCQSTPYEPQPSWNGTQWWTVDVIVPTEKQKMLVRFMEDEITPIKTARWRSIDDE